MIYELKILYLGINKVWRLSDKATQFRGDKSDFVRPIYELVAIIEKPTRIQTPKTKNEKYFYSYNINSFVFLQEKQQRIKVC